MMVSPWEKKENQNWNPNGQTGQSPAELDRAQLDWVAKGTNE